MTQTTDNGERPALTAGIGRAGRYLMVSVVNVFNHQLILQLAVNLWDWSGGWANAFAATVASGPAYLMSRYWVWRVRGRSSLRNEVLPFWALAILGLVVSSITAEVADRVFDNPLMISAGSLIGYTAVWVLKFVLLDRLFAASRKRMETAAEPVTVGR